MEETKKAEQQQDSRQLLVDPEAFSQSLEKGLELLIEDEILREKVAEWTKGRMGELVTVVIQQAAGIKQLSLVLDDVLSQLRRWAWSPDKGWMRARAILDGVLKNFKRRTSHGGDGSQEHPGATPSKDGSKGTTETPAASGTELRGEA